MAEPTRTTPDEATPPAEDGGTSHLPPEPGDGATQEEIVADIEQTREQLRQTVDSLSAKLDVKGNAKARVQQAKETAGTKVSQAKQQTRDTYDRALQSKPVAQVRAEPAIPAGVAVAVVLVVVGLTVWGRRR